MKKIILVIAAAIFTTQAFAADTTALTRTTAKLVKAQTKVIVGFMNLKEQIKDGNSSMAALSMELNSTNQSLEDLRKSLAKSNQNIKFNTVKISDLMRNSGERLQELEIYVAGEKIRNAQERNATIKSKAVSASNASAVDFDTLRKLELIELKQKEIEIKLEKTALRARNNTDSLIKNIMSILMKIDEVEAKHKEDIIDMKANCSQKMLQLSKRLAALEEKSSLYEDLGSQVAELKAAPKPVEKNVIIPTFTSEELCSNGECKVDPADESIINSFLED